MIAKTTALAALAVAGLLAGCGKQGDLERPAPLWGAEAQARYRAERCGQAATPKDSADPTRTALPEGCGNDERLRTADPRPSRTVPIEGMSQNPTSVAPQGALPDPYAHPQ